MLAKPTATRTDRVLLCRMRMGITSAYIDADQVAVATLSETGPRKFSDAPWRALPAPDGPISGVLIPRRAIVVVDYQAT